MEDVVSPRFTDMPARIARLPLDHRGFPVPWFVAWVDGKPDHRVMDTAKVKPAVKENRCWICGDRLGRHRAFVIGPMCAITRTAPEPPAHRDCAVFAAKACPFLSIPEKKRRDKGLPEEASFSENGLKRNPGVTLIWITETYQVIRDPGGPSPLFKIGDASTVEWVCQGRAASRQEAMDSIESGLPALVSLAEAEGPASIKELADRLAQTVALVYQSIPIDHLPRDETSL